MDKDSAPVVSAIALNTIFGNEPKFSHNLIDALGSAEAVFALSEQQRLELFGPYNARAGSIGPAALEAAQLEYEQLSARGIQFLDIFDEGYPEALRECPDAPLLLYVRSATPARELFGRRPAVSIVGTRDQSLYGRACCQRIVRALGEAPCKPLIISGLALGVDITAHAAALDSGLPTIGVSPVGVEDVYPRRHSAFVERMVATPGCALVTDYPPGTYPAAFNFLRRNRIIAGLSRATLVVESRIRGGALITARLAHEYGREVYAVPGRMDDPRSAGCNLLIRERVAEILPSPADLPAALGLGFAEAEKGSAKALEARIAAFAEGPQRDLLLRLAQLVAAERGLTVEELSARLDRPYAETSVLAGLLENEGILLRDLLGQCRINAEIV